MNTKKNNKTKPVQVRASNSIVENGISLQFHLLDKTQANKEWWTLSLAKVFANNVNELRKDNAVAGNEVNEIYIIK